MYVIGQQPRRDKEVIQKSKFGSCPEKIDHHDVESVGYFHRVAGTRKFCTYILVYHRLKAASDPKLKIPRVATPIKNIIPHDADAFFEQKDLTNFVCDTFIPSRRLEELDQSTTNIISSCNQIASSANYEKDDEVTIPVKRFKEWTASVETFKSALDSAKEENYTIEDEITQNRMVFQKLSVLVKKHGYTMDMNSLKSFTLPVTEYARSRNDHCLIHYDHYYKTEKVNFGVIISPTSGSAANVDIEIGNTAAGVIEFKNDGYSVDQTTAEMIRIAGDVALLVLTENKQLHQIMICGVAADYKSGGAMLIKMELDCVEETLQIKQSIDTIPFYEALNAMMNMIKLQ